MNVAVIGSGGREHAICETLSRSPQVETIYAIPGNPGMAVISTCIDIDPLDFARLHDFCETNSISLIIPGSETYLEAGITDYFQQTEIHVFGPTKNAAQLETSKQFAKDLMRKYDIPTAQYEVFDDYSKALSYVRQKGIPIVIKYDGLAGGKGVVVATHIQEAEDALKRMLRDKQYGTANVVIEEYLEGPEFSLMCFVHNDILIPMPIAQDHKRLLDGDLGPNTGGMGIYSSVPIIPQHVIEIAINTIIIPTIQALKEENIPYTGFLYGGLMNTSTGPKVIEFNARFGDPEAEVILPKLETDLIHIIQSIQRQNIPEVTWSSDYILGVVMAAQGYPLDYQKGIILPNNLYDSGIYHMGTTIVNRQLITSGGRVLCITGRGKSLQEARHDAYERIRHIQCPQLHYRKDIGHQSL